MIDLLQVRSILIDCKMQMYILNKLPEQVFIIINYYRIYNIPDNIYNLNYITYYII